MIALKETSNLSACGSITGPLHSSILHIICLFGEPQVDIHRIKEFQSKRDHALLKVHGPKLGFIQDTVKKDCPYYKVAS